MPKRLLVKSGKVENPVTSESEQDLNKTRDLLAKRKLQYLGTELPIIGETTRMVEFAGPEHVVLKISESEASELGLKKSGFYLVQNLKPAEVVS